MRILELQLQTNKLKEQMEFYTSVLGLKTSCSSSGSVTFDIGSSNLTFTDDLSIENPFYHFAINIPENQINEAIHWLKSKTELMEYKNSQLVNFPNWNAHSVYFYDAGGNIAELIARHNLNNASNKEFTAASFLNISEVGMPVDSIKDFYNSLNQKLNEKLWWGNLETFAAIGDEEGLFIAVPPQRNWFPTDKPSRIFPLTVKTENKKALSSIFEYSCYKIFSKPITL